MEEIKEIIRIFEKQNFNQRDIFGFKVSDSKALELFLMISQGEVQTDKEAFERIYPGKELNKRSSYSKLKSTLKRRLLGSILFLNTNNQNESDRKQLYFEMQRNFLEIKLLVVSGSGLLGLKMAKKLSKQAEIQEFWDITLFLLQFIRRSYRTMGEVLLFDEYNKKLTQVQETYSILLATEGLYYRLTSQAVASKTPSPQLLEEAENFENNLIKKDFVSSERIFFLRKAIFSFRLMATFKYAQAAEVLTSSVQRLKENSRLEKGAVVTFLSNLASCNIYLKKFKDGEANIVEALELTTPGTLNWFQVKSLYPVLAFHSGDYEKILPIYIEVTRQKDYKKIPPIFKEIWELNFAWIRILERLDKVSFHAKYTRGKFSLDSFIKKVKQYAKDKEGLNVNILVWKVMWLMLDKDYDALLNMEDRVKTYRNKYAKKKSNVHQRAYLILRYIQGVIKREFLEYKCETITATVRKKIESKAIGLQYGNYDIEIIPFEVVVDLFEEILNRNRRRIRQ